MNMFTLICLGPLAGARKRDPHVIHAITLENGLHGFVTGRMPQAACGVKHLRYFATADGGKVLVWPIRAKGELTRCRECWVATGKKRPRRAA